MEIVFTKTGKFSCHPVHGPVIDCVEGETVDLPDEHALILLDDEWADEVDAPVGRQRGSETHDEPDETDDGDDQDDEDVLVPPWAEEDWDPGSDDAKDKLEAFADECGIDINKRKSVKNIIKAIKEAFDD